MGFASIIVPRHCYAIILRHFLKTRNWYWCLREDNQFRIGTELIADMTDILLFISRNDQYYFGMGSSKRIRGMLPNARSHVMLIIRSIFSTLMKRWVNWHFIIRLLIWQRYRQWEEIACISPSEMGGIWLPDASIYWYTFSYAGIIQLH